MSNIDKGWWIDFGSNKPLYRGKSQGAIQPKFCPDCRRQWQEASECSGRNLLTYFYNLPNYGREKEICPECIKEK
ncbi:MAG: hypothetical protein H8D45_30640 [Bacteroidetes bacterium]|nr:hypothetical protein [Bacteroidota bacterium]